MEKTGFHDSRGVIILEGDILVGKTDQLNPRYGTPGLYERDYVTKHKAVNNPLIDKRLTKGWFWNGHRLDSVAKNTIIIGNIFTNPELLLVKEL